MCRFRLMFLMQILYQNAKKKMTYRTGYKIHSNKKQEFFYLFIYHSASVHEIGHARALPTLPTSFRIFSVGDIFVNKL